MWGDGFLQAKYSYNMRWELMYTCSADRSIKQQVSGVTCVAARYHSPTSIDQLKQMQFSFAAELPGLCESWLYGAHHSFISCGNRRSNPPAFFGRAIYGNSLVWGTGGLQVEGCCKETYIHYYMGPEGEFDHRSMTCHFVIIKLKIA